MFVARYLDIFTGMHVSLYTIIMKVFYILGSFATVLILLLAFWTAAITPSEKRIVRTIVYTVLSCFVLGMAFHYGDNSNFTEIWWAFSIYVGAVADIPQLVEYYNSEERDTTLTAYLILIFTACIFQALSWPLRYVDSHSFHRPFTEHLWAAIGTSIMGLLTPSPLLLALFAFCPISSWESASRDNVRPSEVGPSISPETMKMIPEQDHFYV